VRAALLVARKSLIEMLREPQLLGLILLMPLIMLGITAASYNNPLLVTHPVLVIDAGGGNEELIEELRAQRYADGKAVFDLTPATDAEAAERALEEQSATVLLAITSDGSKPGGSLEITVRGDALHPRFYRASTILSAVAARYADQLAGRPEVVRVQEQAIFERGPQTELDLYAPGMIVMGLLLIIPQTAMLVAREIRWNTLRRLRLTRLRTWDLLAGVSLAQMVIALLQVVLVFFAALAMGFHNQGSLATAIAVGMVISFSAIGLGLVVACFVENDSQAANVGATIAMVLVFISGSFGQFPPLTLFNLAGHQIDAFDIFPSTHGFLALQQVLSYGAGWREIAFRVLLTVLLSLLCFAAGVATFRRKKMRQAA
jgi:ABC-2 type transport system permease protein